MHTSNPFQRQRSYPELLSPSPLASLSPAAIPLPLPTPDEMLEMSWNWNQSVSTLSIFYPKSDFGVLCICFIVLCNYNYNSVLISRQLGSALPYLILSAVYNFYPTLAGFAYKNGTICTGERCNHAKLSYTCISRKPRGNSLPSDASSQVNGITRLVDIEAVF